MPAVSIPLIEGDQISPDLFGGNFLADRYSLGRDSDIAPLIQKMGVNGLRYPGGSLTERHFDIGDPDNARVVDASGNDRDFVPLSDFMSYAASKGHAATIVIPTRDNLSNRADANGDRFPAFDEAELRGFVRDVATGEYGKAEVAAFEIGNEYWGSGEMTAVEYGRVSSRMADIIDDEMSLVMMTTGRDPGIDVIVQAGTNHGFSNLSEEFEGQPGFRVLSTLNDRYETDLGDEVLFANGGVNWRAVNDHLILREFSPDEGDAIDGVVLHIYSRSQISPGHREFGLKEVNENWGDRFDDLDVYVTEWNVSASDQRLQRDEHFGLDQAHELLNMMETMVAADVDTAHVWPLLQNTRNALSTDRDDGDLTVGGEMFAMMARSLPGKTLLDFAPNRPQVTEHEGQGADIHGFYGDGEMVLYIASTSARTETTSVDLTSMVQGGGRVSAKVLGVERGDTPDAVSARPEVEALAAKDFYQDGVVVATLDAG
ncbi:MAG: type I secretion protein, partial [Pseudomonadota bacterium]